MSKHGRRAAVRGTQILIGMVALAVGTLLYIYDRPAALTYFVPEAMSRFQQAPRLFGILGNQLPTGLHVFAFCLISCGALASSRRQALGICALWALLDGAFEIGQQPDIARRIAGLVPDWFARVPILDNTRNHFLQGQFDPLDLLSILLGAAVAYGVVAVTTRRDPPNPFP